MSILYIFKPCKFKVGQHVYVVDYWGTDNGGAQAFETEARILKVNQKNQTFLAILYGDTYTRYSFKNYGRLIFDTEKEAAETAHKLPKPQTEIFQVVGKKIYKRLVDGIAGEFTDEMYGLVVCLENGKNVSIKEIGQFLFFSEFDARENKKYGKMAFFDNKRMPSFLIELQFLMKYLNMKTFYFCVYLKINP